ncbi:MAG: glycosyl transferase [Lachnospiraceae bacterium]|nr:glycosyl transferase [Lachnospiraceae bacterium]
MDDDFYIFGAGTYGKLLFLVAERRGFRNITFLDNDKQKQGKDIYHGALCMSPYDVSDECKNNRVLIAIKNRNAVKEISRQLTELGFKDFIEYDETTIYDLWKSLEDKEAIQLSWELSSMRGRPLNLENPTTFNEKIQWLKLYDRNPLHTTLVDKYAVKTWVAKCIGDEHIIPTLGVWEKFDDIDFDELPDKFVLKCTHDTGSIMFCTGKKRFDYVAAQEKLTKCLGRNYFWVSREWPYRDVPPRIIAEPYMVDESGDELKDYKIQVFGEEPKFIQVDFGRFSKHERNLYTLDWEYIPASILYPTAPEHIIDKPDCLEEMIYLAKKLSKGMIYDRVDFYIINSKVYFGEITFHHGSGHEIIKPLEFENKMSEWLHLPFEK